MKEVIARRRASAQSVVFRWHPGQRLFTSRQVGTDPRTGEVAGPDVRSQTRQAIANVEAILKAGGSGRDQLVKTTVFLADVRLFDAMNEVYRELIPEPRPGRSTVEAKLARPERH